MAVYDIQSTIMFINYNNMLNSNRNDFSRESGSFKTFKAIFFIKIWHDI
jgi:hypothetical protein